MNENQKIAIRNAFTDLIRCIRCIDDEELSDSLAARFFAVSSMEQLNKAFHDILGQEETL